jgi:hypothetical protein
MVGGYPPPPPPPRRRRGPIVIAAVAVFVLLLSGGAYAGLRAWYGWGNSEPESAVPAGVLAFARLDLDPGYSEKLKLGTVLSKFPKPDSGTQVAQVERNLFDTSGQGLDFATDVQPWFAHRAGVAVWQGSGDQPVFLVALASNDDGKAASALARAQSNRSGNDRFGYTVKDGYALLAVGSRNGQADADAARTAVNKQSLGDSGRFSDAMSRLAGAHVALVYVDLAAIGAAAKGPLADLVPTRELGSAASDLSKLTGTLALTADAASNGVEVRFAGTGLTTATTTVDPDAKAALDALPGGSLVAGALPGLDPNGSTTSSLSELVNGSFFGASGPTYGRSQAEVKELADGLMAFVTARTISFAFTKVDSDGPSGLVAADTRDSAAAAKVNAAVQRLMRESPSAPVNVDQQGTTVRIRMGNPDTSGRLSDRDLYREAMAGMPDRPGTAFYADIQQLIASVPSIGEKERRAWAPVKAVGFAVSRHGGNMDGLLRVVIR